MKFDWQLENEILAELIWEQDFNPLTPDLSAAKDDITVTFLSFNLISCNEKTINDGATLDISYFHEFRNCKSGVSDPPLEAISDEATLTDFLTEFKGVRIKTDASDTTLPQFPVIETWDENIFFSFGQDWMFRDYLFPAYFIPGHDEFEYALKVRLSIYDQRIKPTLELWQEWQRCTDEDGSSLFDHDLVCGSGRIRKRERACPCSD